MIGSPNCSGACAAFRGSRVHFWPGTTPSIASVTGPPRSRLGGVLISAEISAAFTSDTRDIAEGDAERHARCISGRALEAAFIDGDVLNKLSR